MARGRKPLFTPSRDETMRYINEHPNNPLETPLYELAGTELKKNLAKKIQDFKNGKIGNKKLWKFARKTHKQLLYVSRYVPI